MIDTVECPYCEHENDMSDGLVDLPSSNTFDHECESCGEEFEVYVEFSPEYSSSKIEYITCENCGDVNRDVAIKGKIFPFPENAKTTLCKPCFFHAMSKEYEKERNK